MGDSYVLATHPALNSVCCYTLGGRPPCQKKKKRQIKFAHNQDVGRRATRAKTADPPNTRFAHNRDVARRAARAKTADPPNTLFAHNRDVARRAARGARKTRGSPQYPIRP